MRIRRMEVGKRWNEDMGLENGGTKSMGRRCYGWGLKAWADVAMSGD